MRCVSPLDANRRRGDACGLKGSRALHEGKVVAMQTIERSIEIKGPVDRVFAYVANPNNLTEWMASLVEVRNVTGTGAGQRFEWTYKMVGLPFQGETTVVEDVPNERRVTQSTGGIESQWTLTFAPIEEGTRLTLEIEYTIPLPVLGKLAERLVVGRNEREMALSLENIKDRCEG